MFVVSEGEASDYGKICTKCKTWCFWEEFGPEPRMRDSYRSNCRRCQADIQKERNRANPERSRQIRRDSYWRQPEKEREKARARNARGESRARKYSKTPDQIKEMYIDQDYRCAWCGVHEKDTLKGKLCIDHDHDCCPGYKSCGKCVRRLLCDDCNKIEGRLSRIWPEALVALNELAWYNVNRNVPNNKED